MYMPLSWRCFYQNSFLLTFLPFLYLLPLLLSLLHVSLQDSNRTDQKVRKQDVWKRRKLYEEVLSSVSRGNLRFSTCQNFFLLNVSVSAHEAFGELSTRQALLL